jgi:hypothetical protein
MITVSAAEIDDIVWTHAGEDVDIDFSGPYV